MTKPSFFKLWVPVVLYAALIFALSSFSFHLGWFQKTQKIHLDWVVHIVEYGVFGALVCRAFSAYHFFAQTTARLFMAVILMGVLYGVSDEFHQHFVPYRDSSPLDVIADTVGVSLGAWGWFKKIRKEYA